MLDNKTRKLVYRRDNFQCALCGDDRSGLQIHHVVHRSQGGTDYPWNLITLCWRCHAAAHGTVVPELQWADVQPAEICQSCVEYLADYYAEQGFLWEPWAAELMRLVPP